MKFFIQYLKQRKRVNAAFILFCAIFAVSFWLYHLPVEAVVYPAILCALTAIVYAAFDLRKVKSHHAELMRLRSLSAELMDTLPPAESIESEDYQHIIRMLREEQRVAISASQEQQAQLIDYYTTWGHQIKTPIAAMRLHLQNEDSPLSRTLSLELMRIEQYVDMLLACLRLGSDSTDYVFREYDLDSIIRPVIRRFSSEFISRRLKLDYQPVEMKIVTDEKWLGFVLEQVLSNALKYTREGSISIYKEDESVELSKNEYRILLMLMQNKGTNLIHIAQMAVIYVTLLFIGICAIPVCLFLGLIAAAWGASESILKLLERQER